MFTIVTFAMGELRQNQLASSPEPEEIERALINAFGPVVKHVPQLEGVSFSEGQAGDIAVLQQAAHIDHAMAIQICHVYLLGTFFLGAVSRIVETALQGMTFNHLNTKWVMSLPQH